MRLIDLDQKVIVPIEDERLGTSYEVQMTVGEIFDKFLEGNKPEVIDAIPVKWLQEFDDVFDNVLPIGCALRSWQAEQEAQDGEM